MKINNFLPAGDSSPHKKSELRKHFQTYRSGWLLVVLWLLALAVVAGVSLTVRTYAVQAFYIKSSSMLPTLEANNRVFVNKLSYKAHEINRGDVVVIDRSTAFGENRSETDDLIKRVVGLSGETLRIRNCTVSINGQLLIEPYLMEYNTNTRLYEQECKNNRTLEMLIPEGHVFVMGDNRLNSIDSRIFGTVSEDSIVGRAFVKVWPIWEFSIL